MRHRAGRATLLVAIGASLVLSCGSGGQIQFMSTGSSGTAGGSTSSGTGGADGGAAGRNATESVNAGTVAKNAQYRMVFTLGQPSPNQQKAASGSLRLQGGLIGSTEKTP